MSASDDVPASVDPVPEDAYRLYYRGEIVGDYLDVNHAFEEMHRWEDPPHRYEWFIARGNELIFGGPRSFGQSSVREIMEGDA